MPAPPTRPAGPDVISSILWDNDSPQLAGGNEVEHSCIEGLEGVCTDFDIDVIDDDPDFISGTNFRLTSTSPCINEGHSQTIQQLGDPHDLEQDGPNDSAAMPDLDNRTRIVGGGFESGCHVVDMGCYEFASGGCTGDIASSSGPGAGDGLVNIEDLLVLISGWGPCPSPPTPCAGDISTTPCGDGTVNIDDLLALLSAWGTCPGPAAGSGEVGDIPEEFYDCWDACSGKPDFAGCMDDCFKALCEMGHTQYCD